MTKLKRSEDRAYTPKPQRPEGNLREEAAPAPTRKPQDVTDEGDPSLRDDLDVGSEEPRLDAIEDDLEDN